MAEGRGIGAALRSRFRALKLELSRQALAFGERLQPKQRRQIAERLSLLTADPSSLPTEQLSGHAPWRWLKSGEFRIIYEIDGETLRVHLIGKRNDDDVYKELRRLRR